MTSTAVTLQTSPTCDAATGVPIPPRRHIEGLDGIRAAAAGLVLLFHYWAMAGRQPLPGPLLLIATNGGVGVDIFFVISGFILFLPWARAAWTQGAVPRRRYFESRLRRVLPAFWFNTAVLLVVATPALLFSVEGLGRLLVYGTFLAGFAPPSTAPSFLLNDVAWTLCIEVVFYLVLPFVARFFVRDRWKITFPAVVVGTLLFKLVAIDRYGDLASPYVLVGAMRNIGGMFVEFAVGMVVAAVWAKLEHRGARLPRGMSLGCTFVGLAGIWLTLYYAQYHVGRDAYLRGTGELGWVPFIAMFPIIAVFAGVMLFGICYQANIVTRLLSLRPIAYLGVVSYGIYLWHLPLGQWLSRGVTAELGSRQMLVSLMLVGTATTIAVAAFSHRFVEQPFLRRGGATAAAQSARSTEPAPRLRRSTLVRPAVHALAGWARKRPAIAPGTTGAARTADLVPGQRTTPAP